MRCLTTGTLLGELAAAGTCIFVSHMRCASYIMLDGHTAGCWLKMQILQQKAPFLPVWKRQEAAPKTKVIIAECVCVCLSLWVKSLVQPCDISCNLCMKGIQLNDHFSKYEVAEFNWRREILSMKRYYFRSICLDINESFGKTALWVNISQPWTGDIKPTLDRRVSADNLFEPRVLLPFSLINGTPHWKNNCVRHHAW